jgi:hypothetical protein
MIRAAPGPLFSRREAFLVFQPMPELRSKDSLAYLPTSEYST